MSLHIQYTSGPAAIELNANTLCLKLPVPHLGGLSGERWPLCRSGQSQSWVRQGLWYVRRTPAHLWFCAMAPAADAELEGSTRALYDSLFALLGGYCLQRIWHYVPRINETGADGLERYQAFCRGRSLAFEAAFADGFETHLPAASGVGCEGDALIVYGCAARGASIHHLENPLQVPAYRYPSRYGPRAPGFARASATTWQRSLGGDNHSNGDNQSNGDSSIGSMAVAGAAGAENVAGSNDCDAGCGAAHEIYISGTASIRAADSVLSGGLAGQLAVTLENLRAIARQCGLDTLFAADADQQTVVNSPDAACSQSEAEPRAEQMAQVETCSPTDAPASVDYCSRTVPAPAVALAAPVGAHAASAAVASRAAVQRRFRVYVRREADCAFLAKAFNALLLPTDEVSYVRSDICRAELDLEIEASVLRPARL